MEEGAIKMQKRVDKRNILVGAPAMRTFPLYILYNLNTFLGDEKLF